MTMKVLAILLSCFCLAFANNVISPDCKKGPEFWCHSLSNAKSCNQLQFCHATVWKVPLKKLHEKELQEKVDGPLECTICEAIVKIVDSYVETNQTEAQALAALNNLCNDLGPVATLCTGLVDSYFPIIWNLLIQETDPEKVCTEIKLCTANTPKVELKKVPPPHPKSEKPTGPLECTICEAIVKIVDSYVETNQTETQALAALKELCNDLGPIATLCTGLVDTYFPTIWNLLIQETDPVKVCTEIQLCTANTPKMELKKVPLPQSKKVKGSGGLECTICEALVKIVDSYIETNETEAQALAALVNFCNDLGPIAGTCTDLVNSYFPIIWALLIKETDPDTVCTEIGLCSAVASKTKELKKVPPPHPKSDNPTGPLECTICEELVTLVDSYIVNNQTEAEALAELDKVCSALGPVATLCTGIVDTYFPDIWNLLVKDSDPDTVCTLIKLCPVDAPKLDFSKFTNVKQH